MKRSFQVFLVEPMWYYRCPYKRQAEGDLRHVQRENVKTESETGAMQLSAKGGLSRSWNRRKMLFWFLQTKCCPVATLISDFWSIEPREWMHFLWSHHVCGNLWQQLQKINTLVLFWGLENLVLRQFSKRRNFRTNLSSDSIIEMSVSFPQSL